jgi:hypothetical protein
LLAINALANASAVPIINLRSLNLYVAAALSDWRTSQGLQTQPPRQLCPGPQLMVGLGASALVPFCCCFLVHGIA